MVIEINRKHTMNIAIILVYMSAITFVAANTQAISPVKTVEMIYEENEEKIHTLGLVVGILLTFYGKKLFKTTLFSAGALIGSTIGYFSTHLVLNSFPVQDTKLAFAIVFGSTILIGIILGILVCTLFYDFGVFCYGGAFGCLLAILILPACQKLAFQSIINYYSIENHYLPLYVSMGVSGLLCGYITLQCSRSMVILASSLCGSYVVMLCVGYYLGTFPYWNIVWNASDDDYAHASHHSITFTWTKYIIGFAILSITGTIIQCASSPSYSDDSTTTNHRGGGINTTTTTTTTTTNLEHDLEYAALDDDKRSWSVKSQPPSIMDNFNVRQAVNAKV